jgi:hypothetical protein
MHPKNLKNILLFCTIFTCSVCIPMHTMAQTDPLIEKVSQKLAQVNDYVAEGVMKTDVSFIKASLKLYGKIF